MRRAERERMVEDLIGMALRLSMMSDWYAE